MALTEEQLAKIIQYNSKGLCSEQGQQKVKAMGGGGNFNNNGIVSDEWDDFSLSDPIETKPKIQKNLNAQISQSAFEKSKMPDNIKESMMKKQIDTSSLSVGLGNTSFLDNLGKQKQQISEQLNNNTYNQQVYQPQQMGIDYSLLKMIVKECLNEYFSNKQLNESTNLKQIGLSKGKIKLVDNSGNVYSADLEYKGNVNERKKQ